MYLQTNSMWCNRSPRSNIIQMNFLSWKIEKCVSFIGSCGHVMSRAVLKKRFFIYLRFLQEYENGTGEDIFKKSFSRNIRKKISLEFLLLLFLPQRLFFDQHRTGFSRFSLYFTFVQLALFLTRSFFWIVTKHSNRPLIVTITNRCVIKILCNKNTWKDIFEQQFEKHVCTCKEFGPISQSFWCCTVEFLFSNAEKLFFWIGWTRQGKKVSHVT